MRDLAFAVARFGVLLLLAAALVVACATSLDSLPAFPCAADGTCPDGFGCTTDHFCERCGDGSSGGVICAGIGGSGCDPAGPGCMGTCTDLHGDAQNCGACGNSCGSASCVLGACTCSSGTMCGTGSSTVCADLTTDASNCGTCGDACATVEVCTMGTCVCTTGTFCPASSEASDTAVCTDLTSDASNCDTCGNVCPGNETCNGSVCGCASPLSECSGNNCANLDTDDSNCGTCGNACPMTQVCNEGTCGCPIGTQLCMGDGTTCINFTKDSNNCGGCGIVCQDNETCLDSVCGCGVQDGGGACAVFPACGCPSGEQCARDDGGMEACVPVGATATGGACSSSANCAADNACVGGLCLALCDSATPCAATTSQCLGVDYDGTAQGFSACFPHCNPLTPFTATAADAACEANQTCVAYTSSSGIYTQCIPVQSSGASGSSCVPATGCAAQQLCTLAQASDTEGTCETYCAIGAGCPSLGAGYTCIPFSPSEMVDGETIGYCGVPCNLVSPQSPETGQAACAPGDTCALVSVSSTVVTECVTVTTQGASGASCSTVGECEEGLGCYIASGTTGTCVAWCTNPGGECANGRICNSALAGTVNGQEYSLCNGTAAASCTSNTAANTCNVAGQIPCSATLCCPPSDPYTCSTGNTCYPSEADALAVCPGSCLACNDL